MPTRNSDLRSSGDTWMLGLGLAETICIIYHGRRNCRRPRASDLGCFRREGGLLCMGALRSRGTRRESPSGHDLPGV